MGAVIIGGAALGLVAGAVAAWLATMLPRRHEVRPETANPRARNFVLVALGGFLGAALAWQADSAFSFGVDLLLVSGLLTASAVDIEHMLLPDELTLGGAALALASSPFRALGWKMSLVGVVAAAGLAYVPHWIYRKVRKRSGAGVGDLRLAFLVGAWLGPEAVLLALLAAAVQFLLLDAVSRLVGLRYRVPASVMGDLKEWKRLARGGDREAQAALDADPMAAELGKGMMVAMLPFGPFLALASLELRFAGAFALSLLRGT